MNSIAEDVKSATRSFSEWITDTKWHGKEHDCVNMFVMHSLLPLVSTSGSIKTPSQIRIEGGVPQPKGYDRASTRKDVVIWDNPFDVTWNSDFQATHIPRVVMEWKVVRKGRGELAAFDPHDQEWLERFTAEHVGCTGYLVQVDMRPGQHGLAFADVRQGILTLLNDTSNT